MADGACPHCGAARSDSTRQEATCRYCGNPFVAASAAEPAFKNEIRALLSKGNTIDAVRRVIDHTGLRVREAKEIVDELQLEQHEGYGVNVREPDFMGEVRRELARGRKINAIKHLRESTNLSLKDAKEAVDALQRGETVDLKPKPIQDSTARPASTAKPRAKLGCLSVFILMDLLFLLIFGGCSLVLQRSEAFQCTAAAIETNPVLREALGSPLDVSSLVLFPNYSSEGGTGWHETQFTYVTLLSGSRDTVLLRVWSYESSDPGPGLIEASILSDWTWQTAIAHGPLACPDR
jgi:ribosomal protein L7/L12